MAMKSILHCVSLLVVLFLAGSTSANDVVIKNGRVIDPETGLDEIRNVAIKDGKIVAISEFDLPGDTGLSLRGRARPTPSSS